MDEEPVTGEIMTPQEVARKMKISPKTVRRWIQSGALSGFQYGRLYRVTRSAFRKFFCEHITAHKKD